MRYRWKTGMLAWVLFRLTGLALVGYLAMHIIVISNLHDPNKFNETMRFLGSWQFRILELGLFFVVLYHALNGIRVIIVDFFNGSVHQAKMFWGLAVLGLILFIAGAYPMVSHALYWKDVQQGKITHDSPGYGMQGDKNEDATTRPKRTVRSGGSGRTRKVRGTNSEYQDNSGSGSGGSSYNSAPNIPPTNAPDPADVLKMNKIQTPPADPMTIQPIPPIPDPKKRGGK